MKLIIFTHHQPALVETWFLNELEILQSAKIQFKIYYIKSNKYKLVQGKFSKYRSFFYPLHRFTNNILSEFIIILFSQLKSFFMYPFRYSRLLLWTITHLNKAVIRSFIRVTIILSKILDFNPDLIYCHSTYDDYIMSFFCAYFLDKKFGTIPHSYRIYPYPKLSRVLHPFSSFIIVKAQYIKKDFIKNNPNINQHKIVVLPWGIDTLYFQAKKVKDKKNRHFSILTVSRLVEMKGIIYLIKACRLLVSRGYKFKCRIVGEGVEKSKLASYIKRYNLAKYLVINKPLPHCPALKKLYFKTDVFVLPSIVDSKGEVDVIPNVLLEAMSMQMPILTTGAGGMEEFVIHKVNGYIAEDRDEYDLVDLLVKIMDMTDKERQNVGKLARETVVKYFDMNKQGEKFIKFLKSQI